MQTPYEILGIGINANDVEIKQAYLQQVKNNPPDRDNEKFQVIHDAYCLIKDETSRLTQELFSLPAVSFEVVIDAVLQAEQSPIIDSEFLKKIVIESTNDSLLNTITHSKK